MSGDFLKAQTNPPASNAEQGLCGVMVGRVINNCDTKHLGRVHVRLAARGGIEIWARVALFDTGAHFIPQEEDEVLVAFNQGDGNEAYVIGSLRNDNNRQPGQEKQNPKTQRTLRTPGEHEITFDDEELSIVIKTKSGRHITLTRDSVEIGVDKENSTVIKLDGKGNLNIEAKVGITLKAPTIKLDATNLKLGSASSSLIEIG